MLSISDWISFLTSEKNSYTSRIFSLTTVIIAAVALIISVTNSNWGGAVGSALIVGALMTAYYKTTNQYERYANKAGQLLGEIMSRDERIMSGNERDLSKIEKRWEQISGKREKEEIRNAQKAKVLPVQKDEDQPVL